MAVPTPPLLSKDQLNGYLTYIDLKELVDLSDDAPRDLALLTKLHVHQITSVPYENLKLHYSADRSYSVDINPHVVLKNILTRRGRGGYCMEVSVLWRYVLESLGFNVHWSGVRIRLRDGPTPFGDYIGLVHMANIVTFTDGSQYICDVAFGGDGPTRPLPLKESVVTRNLGTQEIRYSRARIIQSTPKASTELQNGVDLANYAGDNVSPSEFPPGEVDDAFTFWVYQYRNKPDTPWNSYYIFQTTPYMYADFKTMSFGASTAGPNGSSPFQTTTILVVKFLREPGESNIHGKRMLVNTVVKETTDKGSSTKVIHTCSNEEDRIRVLKEYFGITLTAEEMEGIRGRITEIHGETVS